MLQSKTWMVTHTACKCEGFAVLLKTLFVDLT